MTVDYEKKGHIRIMRLIILRSGTTKDFLRVE